MSRVTIQMRAHGDQSGDMPVQVEVFDRSLHSIRRSWVKVEDKMNLNLKPGLYGIRATVGSGVSFEQSVKVRADKPSRVEFQIDQVSPHESHEWAYITQASSAPLRTTLAAPLYEGLWLRQWQRRKGRWELVGKAGQRPKTVEWADDGVLYGLRSSLGRPHMIQIGGSHIASRMITVPAAPAVKLLIRPAPAVSEQVHPVEVVISSENWKVETLLSLMRRGDTESAGDLFTEARIAERLLYDKVDDPLAAAVGGYFLLRQGKLQQLHNWPRNLSNWFPWLPDGAVIYARQLLLMARDQHPANGAAEAQKLLLEACRRGLPVYTEGLRLLRDGLLRFRGPGRDEAGKVGEALGWLGNYLAAVDWSSPTTSFIGTGPREPVDALEPRIDRRAGPRVYVYDVPLAEALRHRLLKTGEVLSMWLQGKRQRCTLRRGGVLRLQTGKTFSSPGAMAEALTGDSSGAWGRLERDSDGRTVFEIVETLRRGVGEAPLRGPAPVGVGAG